MDDGDKAHGLATAATIAFVAGAALLAGSAGLYLTAPKGTIVAMGPTISRDGAGLRLKAVW